MSDRFVVLGKYEALKKELYNNSVNASAILHQIQAEVNAVLKDFEEIDFQKIGELARECRHIQSKIFEIKTKMDEINKIYNIED